MCIESITLKLREILSEYFDEAIIKITHDANYVSDLNLDSFEVMQFLDQVEEVFTINLTPEEILSEGNHTLQGLANLVFTKIGS